MVRVSLAFYAQLITIETDMGLRERKYSPAVAAILVFLVFAGFTQPAFAQTETLDNLFEELKSPMDGDWRAVENRIWKEWSRSGSDSMDLLLERGRLAMRNGDLPKAIEHFSALIDHAPKFAEGWNARATAFFLIDEFGMSVSDIEVTLSLNPRHFGALSGLGLIFEQTDRPESALKAYEAALAVHPHRPNVIEAVKRLREKTEGTSL